MRTYAQLHVMDARLPFAMRLSEQQSPLELLVSLYY